MLSVKNEALRKFIPFHRSMAFIEKGYKLIFHFNFLFSILFFFFRLTIILMLKAN